MKLHLFTLGKYAPLGHVDWSNLLLDNPKFSRLYLLEEELKLEQRQRTIFPPKLDGVENDDLQIPPSN